MRRPFLIFLLLALPTYGYAQPTSENYSLENYSVGGPSQSLDATSTNFGADLESGGRYVFTSATTTATTTDSGGGGSSSSDDEEESTEESTTSTTTTSTSTAPSSEPTDPEPAPEETEPDEPSQPLPSDPEPTEDSDTGTVEESGGGGGGGESTGDGEAGSSGGGGGGGTALSDDSPSEEEAVDSDQGAIETVGRAFGRAFEAVVPTRAVESVKNAVTRTRQQLQALEPALETLEPVSRPAKYSGVTLGLVSTMFASSRVPFALSNLWHILSHGWVYLLGYAAASRRRRPWGTVYDSVTKAPLDPALVELIDQQGESAADAITDLDGRYGFVVPEGNYQMQVKKTNYSFPSVRQHGKKGTLLYSDLYFGGPFQVAGAVNRDIPLDPIDFDWNQFEKLRTKQTHFYHRFDHLLLYFFNFLFYAGGLVALTQFLVRPDLISGGLLVIYVLLVVYRFVRGGPTLYGTIERNGRPVPYAVVRVMRDDVELQRKVADKYGRYAAIVSPGTYEVVVEEQVAEDEYVTVFRGTMNAKKGIINDDLTVSAPRHNSTSPPQPAMRS